MLIKDIEKAIGDASRPNLTSDEYHTVKSILLQHQSQSTPPDTLLPRVNSALSLLEHHKPISIHWYQNPSGLVFIAVAGGVLTYGALLLLGWVSLPNG